MSGQNNIHCHFLVKKTAMDMAREVYDMYASYSNEFYKENKNQESYAQSSWHLFLEPARATLAKLLTTPIDESLKNDIHHALIQDNALRSGRSERIAKLYERSTGQ